MKKGCSESEAGACMYRLLFFHSTIGLFKNEKLHGTSVFRFNICLKINDYKKTRLANISKKTKNRYNKLCIVSLHKNGKRNATVYCHPYSFPAAVPYIVVTTLVFIQANL